MASSIEDLSAIARRRALTLPEARRLELALKSSDESRLLHRAGCDYDHVPDEQPDAAFLERLAERAVERYARPGIAGAWRRSGRRRRVVLLGVAALLGSALATGAWGFARRSRSALPAATLTPSTRQRAGVRSVPVRPLSVAQARPGSVVTGKADDRTAAQEGPSAHAPGRAVGQPLAVRAPSSPPAWSGRAVLAPTVPPGGEAAALFARANAERKTGNVTRALTSYVELQRRHPSTPEARLSHVLAARLLLRRGDFSGALQHFESYLALGHNGALTEEALQGRADALGALGRRAEARRALSELVRRFPNSIQARVARERLASRP
jgi:TolA-binding protein